MGFAQELNSMLVPYRVENRRIVTAWILDGEFGRTYPAFLLETYHYIKHCCPLMRRAMAQMDDANFHLTKYLQRHIVEETGYERWVLSDLEQFGVDRNQAHCSPPLHETMNLIGSQLYVIDYLHPAGLLGYMYMLESQPLNQGSLTYLQKKYGIRPEMMSCLLGHCDADPKHRLELIDMLDRHVTGSRERHAVVKSAVSGKDSIRNLYELSGASISCSSVLTEASLTAVLTADVYGLQEVGANRAEMDKLPTLNAAAKVAGVP